MVKEPFNGAENNIVFISRQLNVPEKMTVVYLMNRLADEGRSVTVITNNKSVHDDYRYDYRISRLSFDAPLKGLNTRAQILAHYASVLPKSIFILTDGCRTELMADLDTIKNNPACKDKEHKVIAWGISPFAALFYNRNSKERELLRENLSGLDAMVSNYSADCFLASHESSIKSAYIPFLYPFRAGEYSKAPLDGGQILLVQTADREYLAVAALAAFAQLYQKNSDITLKIVLGSNVKVFSEKNRNYYLSVAQAFGVAQAVSFAEHGEKFRELVADSAFAWVTSRFASHTSASIQLFSRLLPCIFITDYSSACSENGINAVKVKNCKIRVDNPTDVLAEDENSSDACISDIATSDESTSVESTSENNSDDSNTDITESDVAELVNESVKLLDAAERQKQADRLSQVLSRETADNIFSLWTKLIDGGLTDESAFGAFEVPNSEDFDPFVVLSRAPGFFAEPSEILPHAEPKKPGVFSRIIKAVRSQLRYLELKRTEKYTFIQMSQESVRRSQLLALSMLRECERICNKHGITYYVAAGSLLGAARHKGQIPWDDDVDVTMPRKDYERFMKIAPGELPAHMKIKKNCYPYGFHRIQIIGTNIERMLRQRGEHGVFLDVLPLDGAAPEGKQRQLHKLINERLMFYMFESVRPMPPLFRDNLNRKEWVKRFIIKMFAPRRLLHALWTANAKKYDVDEAEEWVCLPGSYGYAGECFPKSFWGEPCMMEYERQLSPVMSHWKEYLELHYGDFMQPPAELEKRTHLLFRIDFGSFADIPIEKLEKEVYSNCQ